MLPKCLVVTVPTAGTPVQLTTDNSIVCVSLLIKALASNAGPTVYVGRSANFNATSGADLIVDINGVNQSFLVHTVDVDNQVGSGGSVEVGRTADVDRWTGVGRQRLDQQRHTDNRIVSGQL